MTEGACVANAGGQIVLWNRAAERILGHTAREARGRAGKALLAGADADGPGYGSCHAAALAETGDPLPGFDVQTRCRGGRPLWLNIRAVAGPDDDRETVIIHLFREVTAARELLDGLKGRMAPPAARSAAAGELSGRELEVLRAVAEGADTKHIARLLHVSPATVRNHVRNILGKLGVHSRLQAVAHAARHRLLQ